MNHYEAKQEARRERLEARADRLRNEADASFRKGSMSEENTGIPFGQPILVGHHSEGRHRAAIARADRAMRKGVELNKAANEAESRAAGVGSGGISSDDPDAVVKLKVELADIEARIIRENAANKAMRKGDWDGVAAAVGPELAAKEKAFFERWGYAGFHVQNRRANALRIKKRIEQLSKIDRSAPDKVEEIGEVRKVESAEENRLQLFFPGKPAPYVIKDLKAYGFRWAPSNGCWQRQLSNGARYAAEQVLKKVAE